MGARRYVDIPSLDGLRAISIGIVFAAHIGLEDKIPGGFGVTVFFVLSGYLITTLLRIENDNNGRISLRRFYVRRVFRILPLFYAVLGFAVFATWFGLGDGRQTVGALIAQALHAANYWAITHPGPVFIAGTGVYWSLAIEEHFYVLFPLAFLVLSRWRLDYRKMAWVFAGVCAAVLAWRCVLVFGWHVSAERIYYGTDTRLDSLLIGCAAGLAANPVIDGAGQSPKALGRWAWAAVGVIVVTLIMRGDVFRETLRYTLQSLAIVAVLRYVVSVPGSWVGRFLNWRPMVWLGQLSYPFYLVHFVVIAEVHKHTTSLPTVAVVSLTVAVPLAAGLRALVERPAQRMRDRVLVATRGAPVAVPV